MNSRAQKLATVEGSPAAVAAHDKQAWLDLFAPDAVVTDPVGSSPHRGHAQLSRFYDTFIAPNRIAFRPRHDIVCDDTVVRDCTLEITMSDAVALQVPVHLRYEMTSPEKLASLSAHWELPGMVTQLLGKGAAALPVAARLTGRLLQNQKLTGTAGFARGFHRVGCTQKHAAAQILRTAGAGGTLPSQLRVAYGTATATATSTDQLTGWQADKFIAAGAFVTASLTRGTEHAVAMIEFRGRTPVTLTVFVDDPAQP
ncbi:nuclear transport factor 2 family protein [Gordonia sp. (in: high G+C Gram-positive bacteria)]|uniref:nuclear transport factor 2 family protein n=1 Tax=Gordonia sp. (in: high G+C Gram-positive bacteria) TaxID=84139 RepID=UPI003C78F8E0